jgi:hypothetical protein
MTDPSKTAPTTPAKDAVIKPDTNAADPKLQVATPVAPTAPAEPKKS